KKAPRVRGFRTAVDPALSPASIVAVPVAPIVAVMCVVAWLVVARAIHDRGIDRGCVVCRRGLAIVRGRRGVVILRRRPLVILRRRPLVLRRRPLVILWSRLLVVALLGVAAVTIGRPVVVRT